MQQKKHHKVQESLDDLGRAIEACVLTNSGEPRSLSFLALSKAFEVALEYGWKHIKAKVEDLGLEALSPKDAVREAARLKVIRNPEMWIKAINTRNLTVHDYFSMSEAEFLDLAKDFAKQLKSDLSAKR